jgi:hypothetical protein
MEALRDRRSLGDGLAKEVAPLEQSQRGEAPWRKLQKYQDLIHKRLYREKEYLRCQKIE